MNQKILDQYLEFSQYTNPGLYKDMLRNLPDKIEDLGLLVRKQLIHRLDLDNANNVSGANLGFDNAAKVPWHRQCEDDNFPTVPAILAELYRRDGAGFITDRAPKNKLVLTCRFVAILTASILKSKGIPARVRVGFAPYIGRFGGRSVVHQVNQYWSNQEKRWIIIDVDASLNRLYFNPYDMPEGSFDFPADAWLNVRSGKEDGKRFCHWEIAGYPALALIATQFFHDFHSLMNSEIIYLHVPEKFGYKNFGELAEKELAGIDKLACLMQNPDENFEKLREVWETNQDFRRLTGASLDIAHYHR